MHYNHIFELSEHANEKAKEAELKYNYFRQKMNEIINFESNLYAEIFNQNVLFKQLKEQERNEKLDEYKLFVQKYLEERRVIFENDLKGRFVDEVVMEIKKRVKRDVSINRLVEERLLLNI
ncbi:MAG: hypothetical protein ISR65_04300 [Bacteriovoracaceae bacterium]|nr:hypothetical protein [Bacteriovoracaceae bacterium]